MSRPVAGRIPALAWIPARGTWPAWPPPSTYAVGVLLALAAATMLAPWPIAAANLQGALAPLASALSLLPVDHPDPMLGATLHAVAASLTTGPTSPAQEALLGDFVRFHAVLAGASGVLAGVLASVAVGVHRGRGAAAPQGLSPRERWATVVALAAGVALFGLVATANTSTALHPVPALQAFLTPGG